MAYYRRTRRAKRKPAQKHTYEVTYSLAGGEIVHEVFRIRCSKLTPALMRSKNAIIGEVAQRAPNNKWTSFAAGALPHVTEFNTRVIREIVEPPLALAVNNEGEKK